MEFEAFKMDGLGNDFVIIDQRINNLNLSNDQILKICDRDFIGCDQLIYINKSQKADADVAFFNSDGSRSDACGNGTRCVAYLLSIEKNKKEIEISVSSKILKSKVLNKEKFGTVIDIDTEEKDIKEASKIFNKIMILCIDRPGFSGQKFNQQINGAIDQAIKLSANNKIKITLDGGMTPELASNYNVDEIVSSSFVLTNSKSIIKILDFQTTDKYENSK